MTNGGVDSAATAAAAAAGGGGTGAAGSQAVVLLVGEHMARVSNRLEEFAELVRWPGGEGKEEEQKAILEKYGEKIRAIVGRYDCELPAVLYERLPNVEIISNFGVGVNNIDVVRAKAKGIQVTNTPDVLTDDVADIALGLILCVSRRLCEADRYVRSGKWVQQGNMPLTVKVSGKTVGILGLGRIGQAIAKRAEGFNCKIAYFSRKPKADASQDYSYHPTPSTLAVASDFLVVACALTPETTHIVNAEVLQALGPRGVLINIGRGPHVDEPALVDALQRGIIGGAGLDVFEGEPEVPEALMKLENVVLLPHVGSATEETRNEMADLTVDNVRAQFEGKALLTPV